MSYKSKQRRKFRHVNAKSTNAAWRDKPASPAQWAHLKVIAHNQKVVIPTTITRGEASERLTEYLGRPPRKKWRSRDAR